MGNEEYWEKRLQNGTIGQGDWIGLANAIIDAEGSDYRMLCDEGGAKELGRAVIELSTECRQLATLISSDGTQVMDIVKEFANRQAVLDVDHVLKRLRRTRELARLALEEIEDNNTVGRGGLLLPGVHGRLANAVGLLRTALQGSDV